MRRTNQIRVLKCLWREKKPLKVSEISLEIELTEKQVHKAIWRLKQRGLIIVEKDPLEVVGYKNPPKNRIRVEINENVKKRIKKLLKK